MIEIDTRPPASGSQTPGHWVLPALLLAMVITGFLSSVEAGAQPSSQAAQPPPSRHDDVSICPAPGGRVVEPYRWYPSLDLARIPFHTAAGPWGPRAAITAPAPPVTRRSVRVTTASQLAAEALVPGTLITVDAELIGPTVVLGDVADVDIVVPPGRSVSQLTIGRYSPPSTTRRVRIRGTTPGTHSGGRIGRITFFSSPAADVIIDGVDLNGEDGKGGNLLWQFANSSERVAIVKIRGHGVGAASLQRASKDIVIAGNRILSGARPREVNGWSEGWGIRGGDRVVVYDNRIEGTRYHSVRLHPEPGPPQYAWIANNIFVDRHEARILDVFAVGGSSSRYPAVWAVCNRVYANSTCMTPSFEAQHANLAVLTFNSFFGSVSERLQRAKQAAHGTGHDYLSGNTFSPWREPPAWEAPGDPAAVPLPPAKPDRYNAALKLKPCPPP